jgi:hypothetical protein
MGLVTNLVALVKKTAPPSPFKKFFTGAARDTAAGGTAAVPPFVTNVTPLVSHGADQTLTEGTRFAMVLPVNQPRTRQPQVLDVFSPHRVGLSTLALRLFFLCVVHWRLHRTPLPVTPDHYTTGERLSRFSS